MEAGILCNDSKSVMIYIMGAPTFIVVGATWKVDTCNINGMCPHTSKDTYNWKTFLQIMTFQKVQLDHNVYFDQKWCPSWLVGWGTKDTYYFLLVHLTKMTFFTRCQLII
jgi:hypothetical protein